MTAGTATSTAVDRSNFRYILTSGTKVGIATAATVLVTIIVSRVIPAGIVRAVLQTIVVLAGAVAATFLPSYWTTARSVQGIAGAAGVGLWGTVVFMAIDIILFRPFKAYPWTWDAIGGGSTWWYLPIWWMVGTFLAWLGGLVTAARAARGGNTAIQSLAIPVVMGGIGGGLGLGLGGTAPAPVGAGAGFVLTLIIFAVIAFARTRPRSSRG
jgi:hypothetical protein